MEYGISDKDIILKIRSQSTVTPLLFSLSCLVSQSIFSLSHTYHLLTLIKQVAKFLIALWKDPLVKNWRKLPASSQKIIMSLNPRPADKQIRVMSSRVSVEVDLILVVLVWVLHWAIPWFNFKTQRTQ